MEGGENKTRYKITHKAREMNVERFFFFSHKFGFDAGMVLSNCWVIIIRVSRRDFGGRSSIVPCKRNSFCTNAKGSWIIRNGVVQSKGTSGCR